MRISAKTLRHVAARLCFDDRMMKQDKKCAPITMRVSLFNRAADPGFVLVEHSEGDALVETRLMPVASGKRRFSCVGPSADKSRQG
jgi:hypothetical protein